MDDLSVKVIGGSIPVTRIWMATDQNHGVWQWLFTPAWSDLQFTYDVIDNSVTGVQRAESPFVKNGSGVFVYGTTGEKQTFIKQTDTGWRWYDTLGNWMTYDADGRLLSYGDRNVTIAYFVRDGQHRISNILDNRNDAAHPVLTYIYADDKLVAISDYSGRTVHYHYTGNQLTSVTDVLGNDWVYNYSGGLLTSWSDPEHGPDVTTTITYSGNRAVAIKDPMGFITTYDYSYDRGKQIYTIVQKNPPPSTGQQSGVRIESHYDAGSKLIYEMVGTRVTYQLKKDGATDVEIDERGLQTRTTYDSQHNPIKVVYPDGTSISRSYDGTYSNVTSYTDELGIQTTYQYDTHGNLTTKTEAVGKPEQRITTYTHDDKGQVLTQTVNGLPLPNDGDPNDSQYQNSTKTWTYDQYGNMATVEDAIHRISVFTHDVVGHIHTRKDPRNYTWTYNYDDAGRLSDQSDPLGHSNSYTYDKVGKRKTINDAMGNVVHFDYDTDSRLISVADPLGDATLYGYDNAGRPSTVTDKNGVKTTYGYDGDGRLKTSTDDLGNVTTYQYGDTGTPFAGLRTGIAYPTFSESYAFDARDRRIAVSRSLPQANGQPAQQFTKSIGYDARGRTTSFTDENGHTTLTAYDALDQEVQTTDALGGVTRYARNSRGSIISVTDANSHVFKLLYDLAEQQVGLVRPLGAAVGFQYDASGHQTVRTSPAGQRSQKTYDEAGRLSRQDFYATADATDPEQSVVFGYDPRDLLLSYTQTGETTSSATYGYDEKGHRRTESVTFGSGTNAFTRSISYTYFPNGLRKTFTYPGGPEIDYTYTAINGLASVGTPDGNSIQFKSFTWEAPTRVETPGSVTTIGLDALQRPLHVNVQSNANAQNPSGTVTTDVSYVYDGTGHVLKKTTEDGEYDYTYDALDRLTDAVPPSVVQVSPQNASGLPVEHYTYDRVFNRLSSAHQPGVWTYSSNNELLSYGDGTAQVSFAYDANGNATKRTVGDIDAPSSIRTFTYNAAERLSKVADNGSEIAQYRYDPFGRLLSKTVGGQVTWFQYSRDGLLAEYASQGAPLRTYGWKPKGNWQTDPLWTADASSQPWHVNYYTNDRSGMPLQLTDSSGVQTWKGISTAFGESVAVHGARTDNLLRFPGQREVEETGLFANGMRDYDPNTGRYIETDPLELMDGPNTYSYVRDDPQTFIDPTGSVRVDCPTCNKFKLGDMEGGTKKQCEYYGGNSSPLKNKLPKIKDCIKKACNDNTIVVHCKNDCPPKLCPGPGGDNDWVAKGVPNGVYDGETITVCLNTEVPHQKDPGNEGWESTAALHELAHSCGWDHGQGWDAGKNQGLIPGDTGPETGGNTSHCKNGY